MHSFDREVNALKKLPNVLPCRRRLVLTNDESGHVEDEHGGIDIMPVWKWLLGMPVMHPGRRIWLVIWDNNKIA